MNRLIGIAGRARSGKDTIAEHLYETYDYARVSFADALKDGARKIFSLSEEQLYGDLKEVVDDYWQMTPREILQRMGTEAMRGEFGPDIWIRAAMRHIQAELAQCQGVVIPDVRFDNEAEAIVARGGEIWYVNRPGAQVVRAHASEAGIHGEYISHWIHNDGNIMQLYDQIDVLARA